VGKERLGRDADPSPFKCHGQERVELYLYFPYGPYGLYRPSVPVQYSYTSTPAMGRTACTEPQCLYSTAIPLLPLRVVRSVQTLSACTVQLYLYSPYGTYSLYRASVPVQYSYTSTVQYSYTFTSSIGRTACTDPQCLYSTAILLLPLWAVRPVQTLSACTVQLYLYSPYGTYSLYRASVPVQYSYTSTVQYIYTSTSSIGLTACTDPQCLYSTAILLLPLWAVRPVQTHSACTVQLYLYFLYRPYGLYRPSVPVQGCIFPSCLMYGHL